MTQNTPSDQDTEPGSTEFCLELQDNQRLANLCGQCDEHLRQIESRLGVEIQNRGGKFRLLGGQSATHAASNVLQALYDATQDEALSPERVHLFLQEAGINCLMVQAATKNVVKRVDIVLKRQRIVCRGANQITYVESIRNRDLTFGIVQVRGKRTLPWRVLLRRLKLKP